LDEVDLADPCPSCGGNRRSATVSAQAATIKAAAPPGTVVGHSYPGEARERIDVGGPTYRSSSTGDPGGGRQVFDGESPLNEQDVQQVCGILREALDAVGDHWDRFRVPPDISDVDAIAEDSHGNRLQVQVTRVERAAWKEVARMGRAESVETDERRATAIWDAVTKKSRRIPPRQRAQLMLVLDAIRTPGYLRSSVIEEFRTSYGEQAGKLGYVAVWLVGPTTALTRQLALTPDTYPPNGSGPARCKAPSCWIGSQDSGISSSRASPPTTATATS